MNIVSTPKPEYTEIPVTDYELLYVGGMTDLITVMPGDSVADGINRIVVSTPTERIIINHAHIVTYRVRNRKMRVLKKASPAAQPVQASEPPPILGLDV